MNGKFRNNYRMKQVVCVILGICAAFLLTKAVYERRMLSVEAKMTETQEELAGEVFRFHVPANSDSKKDQDIKLKVRDRVIAYMKESMPEEEAVSAKGTEAWAKAHLKELEHVAEAVIEEEGETYGARAEVISCYFPDKRYGDIVFPKGYYRALRIGLGEAKGHNWWCVLYPNLCFTDTTCAVVSDEGKEELKSVLTEDEYEMVTAASDFKIKSFFFEDVFGGN